MNNFSWKGIFSFCCLSIILLNSCNNNSSSPDPILYIYPANIDDNTDNTNDNTDYDDQAVNENDEDNGVQTHLVQCSICHGLGSCGGCAGTGQIYSYSVYTGGEYISCGSCNGSGRCGLCDGSGMMEEVIW